MTGKTDANGSRIPCGRLSGSRVSAVYPHPFQAAGRVGKLPADGGMLQAKADHITEKIKQLPVLFQKPPVQPGNLVVLTVGVVVSILGIAEFISGQEHGRAPAAQKHCTGVADQAHAQGKHGFLVRLSFCPAVPAPVVVRAVRIVPAVGLVVLFIIGIQIVQGKAVVAGEEIHAGIVARVVPDPPAVFPVFLFLLPARSVHVEGTRDPHGGVFRFPEVSL